MKKVIYLVFCLLILACSKNSGNNPTPPKPEPDSKPDPENTVLGIPMLVFPAKDQLCLDSNLTFDWSNATDAVSYQIQISTNRAFTAIVEDQIVSDSSLALMIDEGQDYYWRVLAIDLNNIKGEYSPNWAFYVQGEASINYLPFMPSLTNPELNSVVSSVNVLLQWESSDLDEDFLLYELYLGTNENPEEYQEGLSQNSLEVTLEPNQTYYWKVHVSDGKSKSIGEVWHFMTN